jgi:hypothetical protein
MLIIADHVDINEEEGSTHLCHSKRGDSIHHCLCLQRLDILSIWVPKQMSVALDTRHHITIFTIITAQVVRV